MIEKRTIKTYDPDTRIIEIEVNIDCCMFCNSEDLFLHAGAVTDSWSISARVECDECEASGPLVSGSYSNAHTDLTTNLNRAAQAAIEAWNRRNTTPVTMEEVAEVRAVIDQHEHLIAQGLLKNLLTPGG